MHKEIARRQFVIVIQTFERAGWNAASLAGMRLKNLFTQEEALVPHQFGTRAERRNKGKESLLFGIIAKRWRKSILCGQIKELGAAFVGSKAEENLTLFALPAFQSLYQRLPRPILFRRGGEKLIKGSDAPLG